MRGRGKGRREKAKGNVIHERNIVVTNVQRRMEGRVEMRERGGMGWYGVDEGSRG